MMRKLKMWVPVVIGAMVLSFLNPTVAQAQDKTDAPASPPSQQVNSNKADMLDQVTLADGRQFTGHILKETDDSITMEIIQMGMRSKMTWAKKDVMQILRNVVPAAKVDADADSGSDASTTSADEDMAQSSTAGAANTDNAGDTRPIVYKIPIGSERFDRTGGYYIELDSHEKLIRLEWKQAMDEHARIVIFDFDGESQLSEDMEGYRDVIQDIKKQAAEHEIKVVAWIKSARGVGVAYALMFPTIYFHEGGEMGGGAVINEQLSAMFQDKAVRAKMISAWVSICEGMAEDGGHSPLLCRAMIRPETVLSADTQGDKLIFFADLDHPIKIDTESGEKPEAVLNLNADQAVRFGISKGTVQTLDDLMFQVGYRDYRYVPGNAEAWTKQWRAGWRDAFQQCEDIQKDMKLIQGSPEAVLAQQIGRYRQIQSLIKKWPPLAKFIPAEQIFMQIDTLKKQLRNLHNGEQGTGGGGGGGGGGGMGPGH